MRITNDDGEPVEENGIEGREVSAPIIFKEYFNNAKATTESFTKDGWFITGDRALISPTDRLKITGRTKETILINGIKYFPH